MSAIELLQILFIVVGIPAILAVATMHLWEG